MFRNNKALIRYGNAYKSARKEGRKLPIMCHQQQPKFASLVVPIFILVMVEHLYLFSRLMENYYQHLINICNKQAFGY